MKSLIGALVGLSLLGLSSGPAAAQDARIGCENLTINFCDPCFGIPAVLPEVSPLCGEDCPVLDDAVCDELPNACEVLALADPGLGATCRDDTPRMCIEPPTDEVCRTVFTEVCSLGGEFPCQTLEGCPPFPGWNCKILLTLLYPVYECSDPAPTILCHDHP